MTLLGSKARLSREAETLLVLSENVVFQAEDIARNRFLYRGVAVTVCLFLETAQLYAARVDFMVWSHASPSTKILIGPGIGLTLG